MAMEINGLSSRKGSYMNISVIILTFNSEETILATLESANKVSDDLHVVDSFSSDKTLDIVKRHNVNLVQHVFDNYGAQRNWAIDNLPMKYDWELHLDADERISDDLAAELNSLKNTFPDDVDGYYIPRISCFMRRVIRHGGMFPTWHMRLFRHNKGRCESREYDQHFYVNGATSKLQEPMIDDVRMSLREWTSRHNRWADAEVREIFCNNFVGRIQPDLRGNPVQKKRFLRSIYEKFPLFVRPFLFFIYRYFLRLGFLDGKEGLIFYVLQTFWFRFLIDAKLFERQLKEVQTN